MRLRPAVLLSLAAGAACGDPLAPLPAGTPRELTYTVDSGLSGVTTDLRLAGDTVVLVSRGVAPQGAFASTVRRVPTAAEWRDFARAAGAAGVRRWPRRCSDDRIADGGGFAFTVASPGERYAGTYYVQSPTAAGRCSGADRADAQAFARAVLALAGAYVLE